MQTSQGSDGVSGGRSVVWGTDINIQEVQDKCNAFITSFTAPGSAQPKYWSMLMAVLTAALHEQ